MLRANAPQVVLKGGTSTWRWCCELLLVRLLTGLRIAGLRIAGLRIAGLALVLRDGVARVGGLDRRVGGGGVGHAVGS